MASLRKPLGLLIDLNGTIHIEDKAIKGSIEAVNLLRRKGISLLSPLHISLTDKDRLSNLQYHIIQENQGRTIPRPSFWPVVAL